MRKLANHILLYFNHMSILGTDLVLGLDQNKLSVLGLGSLDQNELSPRTGLKVIYFTLDTIYLYEIPFQLNEDCMTQVLTVLVLRFFKPLHSSNFTSLTPTYYH